MSKVKREPLELRIQRWRELEEEIRRERAKCKERGDYEGCKQAQQRLCFVISHDPFDFDNVLLEFRETGNKPDTYDVQHVMMMLKVDRAIEAELYKIDEVPFSADWEEWRVAFRDIVGLSEERLNDYFFMGYVKFWAEYKPLCIEFADFMRAVSEPRK